MSELITSLRSRTLLWNLVVALGLLLVAVALVAVADDYNSFMLGQLGAYICAGVGLTILIGGNGQISLGHAALMAVGAYAMAMFLQPRSDVFGLVGLELVIVGLVFSTLVATIVGGIIGLAAARLRGPYLAGATLTLGVSIAGIASFFHGTFNGDQGLSVPQPQTPTAIADRVSLAGLNALIALAAAVLVLFFAANLKRSAVGRHLNAVRDDEIAAQLCGLSVSRERVRAFAISSATAGLGGGVLGLVLQLAQPGLFGIVLSMALLGAVVIGGLGSLRGAVWGSIIIVYLAKFLNDLDFDDNLPTATYGLLLIVVMLVAPGGIQGVFALISGRWQSRAASPQGGNR